jgi:prepilin-type processing-associated H-X9-DG protein
MDLLQPYTRNWQLYVCASGSRDDWNCFERYRAPYQQPRTTRWSYSYSSEGLEVQANTGNVADVARPWLLGLGIEGHPGAWMSCHETEVPLPAETLMMCDGRWWWLSNLAPFWPSTTAGECSDLIPTCPESNSNTQHRHNEGLNALFVDGHTKWLRKVTAPILTRAED